MVEYQKYTTINMEQALTGLELAGRVMAVDVTERKVKLPLCVGAGQPQCIQKHGCLSVTLLHLDGFCHWQHFCFMTTNSQGEHAPT
ncbi:hypothetical protein RvY_17910 [Ramazzottius varieornatus]|uniref:Uncharacterized protein n=1 Tax=Ramazzottius varieornatus TaxID=947166 RepID=A0A1D1WAC4_RAMVA|nr:hypothetical protein RvY_17910 [Ramazzottius varieornatus]